MATIQEKESSETMVAQEKVYAMPLHDLRGADHKIGHPPTMHIARGYNRHLPFLKEGHKPIICISDWQYETDTQRHFWEQAHQMLKAELGEEEMASAIILVAGDMASADNNLRGSASDAAPDLQWLHDSVPNGDVFMVYGNHDNMTESHVTRTNPNSGMHCVLPHGGCRDVPLVHGNEIAPCTTNCINVPETQVLTSAPQAESSSKPSEAYNLMDTISTPQVHVTSQMTKEERAAHYAKMKFEKRPKLPKQKVQDRQWRVQNLEHARLADALKKAPTKSIVSNTKSGTNVLRIGAVHGIPASHNEGMKKIERTEYLELLHKVCSTPELDILVTHSNTKVPRPEHDKVRGEDAPKIFQQFLSSNACLHIHGHMHTDPVVTIVSEGKIVVNSDCRIVAFVP